MSRPPADEPVRDLRPHRVAAALAALEGIVLLGFTVFYVYEIATGAADNATQGATQAGLILVFALGMLALARGWARFADWPRTPTLLWNALLLPVAWSLFQSERTLVALGVGLLAIASIGAGLVARPSDPVGLGGPDGQADRQSG